jgi:hypothetical protein
MNLRFRDYFPYVIIILLAIAALLLLRWGCGQVESRRTALEMYDAAHDSLRYSNDNLTATIRIIEAGREKDFLKMHTTDSLIMRLQKEVKAFNGKLTAATIVQGRTVSTGTTATTVTIDPADTARTQGDPCPPRFIWPTYKTDWDTKYSRGFIRATRDSIFRTDTTLLDLTFTSGYKKRGLFKRGELEVSVTTDNPSTLITGMRSYAVKEKRGRFTVTAYVGFGGQYGLLHQRIDVGPQMGAGVGFAIWP